MQSFYRYCSFTALIVCCSIALNAQDNKTSFALEEAQQYGVEHNENMLNARLDQERAGKDVNETLSRGLPQINFEANARKNFDIRTNIISFRFPGNPEPQKSEVKFGTKYNFDAQVSASQMIFDGTFFLGLKASRTYVKLSKREAQQTQIETRSKIAKAYYSSLVTEENLRIINKNIKQVEQNLYETRELYKNGFVEELDVDRLRLSLQNLQNQQKKVKREYQVARKLLKFQMGYPVTDTIVLTDSLNKELPKNKNKKATPEDFKPNERIEYKVLKVQEKLAKLNKKQFQAGYLPKLNAFATHLQNAQRDEFNLFDENGLWFPSTYAGLSLEIPIFDGFYKSAKIQKAKIDQQKIQNQQKNLRKSIRLEVSRSLKEYNTALDRAKNQKENMELARKIYNTSQTKYKEGVGSSLEVTTAQSDLFQSQSDYINAIYDYLIAEIELNKSLAEY